MAELPLSGDTERVAVVHATGVGGQATQDESYERIYGKKTTRVRPTSVPKLSPSAGAALISMDLGITGPAFATTSACSSSGHAVAMGVALLQSGMVDAVVVGGAEAPLVPGCIRGWEAMRVLAHDTCRPFSAGRGGVVLGEGGASMVLETLESATKRGVKPVAVVAGCGMSSDAQHYIQPSVDGPRRAIIAALGAAKLRPEDVHYVNAHGTGTGHNDSVEARALHAALGDSARTTLVSSTKSMHGHTLGAASALELSAVLAAFHHQAAPPTMNYLGKDPECDLDVVPNEARSSRIENALCNSLGFGGLNVCIALRRFN
jgi:nodulation protein E